MAARVRLLHSQLRATASFRDAKSLYRQQAKLLHPDTVGSNDDFRALQEAWDCYESEKHVTQRKQKHATDTLEMVLLKLRANIGLWDAHQMQRASDAVEEAVFACGVMRFGESFEQAKVHRMDTASHGVLAMHIRTSSPRHRELVADVCGDTDSASSGGGQMAKFAQPASTYNGPASFSTLLQTRYLAAGGELHFTRERLPITYSSHCDERAQSPVHPLWRIS